jgi:hypothetical protein
MNIQFRFPSLFISSNFSLEQSPQVFLFKNVYSQRFYLKNNKNQFVCKNRIENNKIYLSWTENKTNAMKFINNKRTHLSYIENGEEYVFSYSLKDNQVFLEKNDFGNIKHYINLIYTINEITENTIKTDYTTHVLYENYVNNENNIDNDKLEQFCQEHPAFISSLKELCVTTQYLTISNILFLIKKNIEKWISMRKNIPLYVIFLKKDYEMGTDMFLYYYFHLLLPSHQIVEVLDNGSCVTDLPNNECELLYIDDWSLTGYQMCSLFNCCIKNKKNVLMTCILATVGSLSVDRIHEAFPFNNIEIFTGFTVQPYICRKEILQWLQCYYCNKLTINNRCKSCKYVYFTPYPIFNEMSIAKGYASFNLLYEKVCKNVSKEHFLNYVGKDESQIALFFKKIVKRRSCRKDI